MSDHDTALAVTGDALELLDQALQAINDADDLVESLGGDEDHGVFNTISSRRDAVVRRYNALRDQPEDR